MKLKQLLFSAALLASMSAMGQSVPTHEMYVDFGITERTDIVSALDKWQPGDNFSNDPNYQDENFFISRVPLKTRFINSNTQANKNLNEENNKNLCWCSPIGEMTKKWGPMPRYNFDGDNFNMWQYINIHANWSNSWFRVPGTFNDVAHKNGVRTGCLYFIDWASQVSATSDAGKMLAQLAAKNEDGTFKYARKLIQFLRYYGIDGIGLNPEGYWSTQLNEDFSSFLAECHKVAEEMNHPFHVEWYAFVSNSGGLSDNGSKLEIGANDKWFHKNGYPVTDVFFLNYNWTESGLQKSVDAAKSLGRSTYDVYAGFDQQGRGYGKYGNAGWTALMKQPVSIVVWGGHDRSQLYAGSTEGGNSDLSVQNEYQKKQELLFTGGSRNVLRTPDVTDDVITSSYSDLTKWHGYSKAVIEESTLTELPFVTRFNLGNGYSFSKEGTVTFDHKWYNIGLQDLLPTWRWWIDNGDGVTIPSDPINCDFTFDDAWFGGSCLKIHGATSKSDIRLFSTKFNIASTADEFTIVFKMLNGTDPKMKLKVSKLGAESAFTYHTLPTDGIVQGKWNTVKIKASELNLKVGDVIGCIGLAIEGTDKDYAVLLGEMSFIPKLFKKTPVTPVITYTNVMKRVYNRADFKVIFDVPFSGTRKEEYKDCPIYNEEVNSWYYEVYVKQGEKETLVTATTSWAAYVVDAPLNGVDQKFQIGVRSVGLDGKTVSPIVWSDEIESDLSTIETLTIDKDIIKPNEEVTIGFEDPNHPTANIEILNALTGDVIDSKENVLKLTTSLPSIGTYDVKVATKMNINGVLKDTVVINRALLLVTPEATGRLPMITNIAADKTEVLTEEKVNLSADIAKGDTYLQNGRERDCSVSQSLYMKEPYQLTVDSKVMSEYTNTSFALWFKVEKFEHASLGTLLMTKVNRNYSGTWTESVWGEMWTAIRPANYSDNKYKNGEDELSVSVDAPPAGTSNYEHNAEVDGMSNGYTLSPNTWYHVCVVKAGRNVKLYLNGKKIIDVQSRGTGPKDWKGAKFYVGGSMTNLASFTGWVDEVQIWSKALTEAEIKESMSGYLIPPTGLDGYFTFESTVTDEDGNIYFPNEGNNSVAVPGANMTIGTTENKKNVDVPQNQLTPALGVPYITGSRPIKFESAKWILDGANFSQEGDNKATATYATDGQYPVTLTLTNSWGSATKTITDYIVVKKGVGIEEDNKANNYLIYPNPFKEQANILFADAGIYNVLVFDIQGKQISASNYNAAAGEVCQLSFDAPQGMYYVAVMQNDKCVQSFKVIKER